jgi:hypothetical protein
MSGDARDFNNIEARAVINFFFFLQGKAPKDIHAILKETLVGLSSRRWNNDVVLRHLWRWLCYIHLCVVVTDVLSLSITARVWVHVISLYYREG